jgi:hypothetical protein
MRLSSIPSKSLALSVVALTFGGGGLALAQAANPVSASGPVIAAPPSGPAPQTGTSVPDTNTAAPQSIDPKDKVICRSRVELGSRLAKRRECLTARQWEDIRAQSRSETRRMQRNMGDKRG